MVVGSAFQSAALPPVLWLLILRKARDYCSEVEGRGRPREGQWLSVVMS